MSTTAVPPKKVNRIGLEVLSYKGAKTTLCAGCGHNAISERIIECFYEMGVPFILSVIISLAIGLILGILTERIFLDKMIGEPVLAVIMITAHGTESFERPAAVKLGRKAASADFVVAVCEYGREQVRRAAAGRGTPRIEVVRCGLDRDFLDAPPTPVPDAPRLVCVARLAPEKGLLVLLDAAARLAEEDVASELVVAGDGALRDAIRAQLLERDLARRVHLAGSLSSAGVRKEIQAARALVLPSLAEGLPVVLMEAFALGRPVVATTVGGVAELVEPGALPAGEGKAVRVLDRREHVKGVEDGYRGDQVGVGEEPLLPGLVILDGGELGHLAGRPRGGGNGDVRRDGLPDLADSHEFPEVFLPFPGQDGDPLGRVHGRPSADGDDSVGPRLPENPGPPRDHREGRIGNRFGEESGGPFPQRFHEGPDHGGFLQGDVRYHQGLVHAQAVHLFDGLFQRAGSEDDSGGNMEAEGEAVLVGHGPGSGSGSKISTSSIRSLLMAR